MSHNGEVRYAGSRTRRIMALMVALAASLLLMLGGCSAGSSTSVDKFEDAAKDEGLTLLSDMSSEFSFTTSDCASAMSSIMDSMTSSDITSCSAAYSSDLTVMYVGLSSSKASEFSSSLDSEFKKSPDVATKTNGGYQVSEDGENGVVYVSGDAMFVGYGSSSSDLDTANKIAKAAGFGGSSMSTTTIVIIVVVAVLLVAAIVVVAMVTKNRSAQAMQAPMYPMGQPQLGPDGMPMNQPYGGPQQPNGQFANQPFSPLDPNQQYAQPAQNQQFGQPDQNQQFGQNNGGQGYGDGPQYGQNYGGQQQYGQQQGQPDSFGQQNGQNYGTQDYGQNNGSQNYGTQNYGSQDYGSQGYGQNADANQGYGQPQQPYDPSQNAANPNPYGSSNQYGSPNQYGGQYPNQQ